MVVVEEDSVTASATLAATVAAGPATAAVAVAAKLALSSPRLGRGFCASPPSASVARERV